ncbi:MAG: dephospho-CoA kinase [Prevotellaceae bacterium]|nr:dephospho-CoA kinase [Prevotellaceae bacterium]
MIKVGVTGGIGSGKTFVCNRLKDRGIPVYNCDDEAKRLMQEDPNIREQLCSLVGNRAYINGCLNKPAIAEFLFASPDNGKKINGIVHPAVKRDFIKWAEQQGRHHIGGGSTATSTPIVAQECALLFEAGFQDTVDAVITVHAPIEVRMERAMRRDNATRQQIEARMLQQLDDEEKISRADYSIINDGKADIEQQIDNILKLITNQP